MLPHHPISELVILDGLHGKIQGDQLDRMVNCQGKANLVQHVRACGVYVIR
jgi:hypothetical protein